MARGVSVQRALPEYPVRQDIPADGHGSGRPGRGLPSSSHAELSTTLCPAAARNV
jgi:hypothetical protein